MSNRKNGVDAQGAGNSVSTLETLIGRKLCNVITYPHMTKEEAKKDLFNQLKRKMEELIETGEVKFKLENPYYYESREAVNKALMNGSYYNRYEMRLKDDKITLTVYTTDREYNTCYSTKYTMIYYPYLGPQLYAALLADKFKSVFFTSGNEEDKQID